MRVERPKKEPNSDEPKEPEQVVKLLRKADEELAKGKAVEDFCLSFLLDSKTKAGQLKIVSSGRAPSS